MTKKVSELQKKQIKELFLEGDSIQEISNIFNFSTQTITRQLKIIVGESDFKKIKQKISIKNQKKIQNQKIKEKNLPSEQDHSNVNKSQNNNQFTSNNTLQEQTFFEVLPVLDGVNLDIQKELSTIPISDVQLPQIVFMIVDKKIELEVKILKDYRNWNFLPIDDLNRKTIEIYFDLKIAKRFCNKEQRVIKVPNTNVFKIVAPLLLSRGITRIVSDDQLIAL